ncbi:hypothetical protein, partial [Catenibacterium mitsuokai]|uniref:hypothetical protein n=1 Tax=Catenibacterium mitsuokai TaxID=100886 RepID=UPI002E763B1B
VVYHLSLIILLYRDAHESFGGFEFDYIFVSAQRRRGEMEKIMNMNTLYFQIVSASGTIKTIQLHEASLVMAFNDYYQYILEERSLSKEDAFKIIDSYITQLDMLKE